ncbi:MAG: hypothetical protein EOO51_00130 [Flavobacterium sp.]|nr:MAG: hypothetical protein EOO51_00130 [Flavobacterium sp.]
MEESEQSQKAINLGKLLVKELELEDSVDTLGRWMAHHLALKMTEAEHAVGAAKAIAEKECSDLILKIWSHRWKKQSRIKPFFNFEQIFETLTQLKPKKDRRFYFDTYIEQKNNLQGTKVKKDDWLKAAIDTDQYARICIDYALSHAVENLIEADQVEWLQNAPELTGDIDIKIMKTLLDKGERPDFSTENDGMKVFSEKIALEKLKSNIAVIESFRKVHTKILKDLKQKLTQQS